MKDFYDSIIRTLIPIIVGSVVGFFTARGIDVDSELTTSLTALIMIVAGGVYHAGVRLLERYVSPKFGWLLGLAQEPHYRSGGKHVAK